MNKDEIIKLQKIARSVAIKRGHDSIADDFAQETVINALTGRTGTIDQQLTDFLRKEFGSSRSECGRLRQFETHGSLSLDAPRAPDDDRPNANTLMAASESNEDSNPDTSDWRERVTFKGRDATIAMLRYDQDWNLTEIAELYGYSETHICQIVKRMDKQIAAAAILDKSLANYRTDPQASQLSIQWIII